MASDLIVHGPIEVPFVGQGSGSSKRIRREQKKAFLATLREKGLAHKQGCYVFALGSGGGHTPWYVGKATKGFGQECMGPHQLNHYNDALYHGYKGTPVMFLVAPAGAKAKVPRSVCDEAETLLIQSAHHKNPLLQNVQKRRLPAWTIRGVVRSPRGKPSSQAKSLRTMMGL